MIYFLDHYWPHILAVLSTVMGVVAAIHATMTKRDVRAAIGWVGVIILSPILGAVIYAVAGVNRIRRASFIARRSLRHGHVAEMLQHYDVGSDAVENRFGGRMGALCHLGERVTRHALSSGNRIMPLTSGDEAYAAMEKAIDEASHSILMETYIFDRDEAGLRLAGRLIAARKRGVEVRVLIDAVGARYSVPSIVGDLVAGGIDVAAFNGKVISGLRLPYANLRTHRKILVVDGAIAFMGGMNIRKDFTGPDAARDTHFRVTGPVVSDLFVVAADDWHFETGEALQGEAWRVHLSAGEPGHAPFSRVVVSGPDAHLESNHRMLTGAFSVAERSIRIMSPYFLPDPIFLAALATAARRGVAVEIVIPSENNLAIVNHAMQAQFPQILRDGCRIFRSKGRFDHSKLLVVDDKWCFVGSSNLDSRSLRLNFEIDLEVYDEDFAGFVAGRMDARKQDAEEVTLESLHHKPFWLKLMQRVLWLASPYL
ncbi:cardiolipin synthase [Allorhizobium sp. BGMRC 0089]|uniref:cardiolipin synthase n=1 Tax=Allorhizobium sonneratiae TaxID=2934936 RepID=UPI002033731C|nr:cardiolipin synthase [Allorhizobium sonneratiae]MCM2294227.1 cardiolipin synthase [Allorhizobium sonneratiae]